MVTVENWHCVRTQTLSAMKRFKLLCPHTEGGFGVETKAFTMRSYKPELKQKLGCRSNQNCNQMSYMSINKINIIQLYILLKNKLTVQRLVTDELRFGCQYILYFVSITY